MDASPAPMMIRHTSSVQKLLAKPQPTDDTIKMAIPQPASPSKHLNCLCYCQSFGAWLRAAIQREQTVIQWEAFMCNMLDASWHVRQMAFVRALMKLTDQSESIVVLAQL